MSSQFIKVHSILHLVSLFFITITTRHCVVPLDNAVQIIVINSFYNNSTVINGSNNFDSFLGGLINSLTGRSTTLPTTTTILLPPSTTSKSQNSSNSLKVTTAGTTTTVPTATFTQSFRATTIPSPVPSKVLTHTEISITSQKSTEKIMLPKPINETKLAPSFNNYLGVTFSPYVNNGGFESYSVDDIKKMLMVIHTKSRSILTFEMGYYSSYNFYGPYNDTASAKVAIEAAKINLQHHETRLVISQGAYILAASFSTLRFPDLDAAFYSAQKANSLHPGTVSSITLFVQDPTSSEYLGLTQNTAYYGTLLLQQYTSIAHSQNLKLGVMVGFCDDILNSNEADIRKILLKGLMSAANYIICEMFPSSSTSAWTFPEQGTTYNFDTVKNKFSLVKAAFDRAAPTLEIVLCTGIPAPRFSSYPWGYFPFHGYYQQYQNPAEKVKHYWDAVERWSVENHQKVYLYQAFDTVEVYQMGYTRAISNGYWKFADTDDRKGKYIIKATDEIVNVTL